MTKDKLTLKEDRRVLFDSVKMSQKKKKNTSKTGETSEKPDLPAFKRVMNNYLCNNSTDLTFATS